VWGEGIEPDLLQPIDPLKIKWISGLNRSITPFPVPRRECRFTFFIYDFLYDTGSLLSAPVRIKIKMFLNLSLPNLLLYVPIPLQ